MGDRLLIIAVWDPEASVWVADSEDVPGLVAEAGTVEELSTKLEDLIPELLMLNDVRLEHGMPAISLRAERPLQFTG